MEKFLVVISLCALMYNQFIRRHGRAELISAAPLLALLILRSVRYRHFPVLGLFETLTFFAFFILAVNTLYPDDRQSYRSLSDWFAAALLAFALFARTAASPFLPDSLNTPLFPVHVALSFVSYAFFTLAFVNVVTGGDGGRTMNLNYFGFVAFTIGLWAGGIWAYKAWGAYFLFSIKEIFSFIVWVFYAAMLHIRFFRERRAVLQWGTVVGFLIVIFTYIGIGLFMRNTHAL